MITEIVKNGQKVMMTGTPEAQIAEDIKNDDLNVADDFDVGVDPLH